MYELYWHYEFRSRSVQACKPVKEHFESKRSLVIGMGGFYAERGSRIVFVEKQTQCYDSGVEWNRLRRRIERINDA